MSWKRIKLEEIVENFSLKAKNDNGAEGLEFFGVSNEVGITVSKYAAEDKAEEYKIIEQGCFAYNPYRINVGSIAYLNEDKKGLISPAYVVFKVKPNTIKEELLLKFLKSSEGLRQIRMYGRGTVRQALRFEDLCKIELSIPTYEEQKVLWGKFEKVDGKGGCLLNELTHQFDLIKQLRQAFLREAIQGKLSVKWRKENPNIESAKELLKRIKAEKEQLIKEEKIKKEKPLPPIKEDEIPFEIPESWVWCRLGEIALFLNGYAFKSEWFKSEGIHLLRNINMGVNEILWNDIVSLPANLAKNFSQYLLQTSDIVLSLDRPIINAGLKVAQVRDSDIPCLLLQRVLKIDTIESNKNYVYKWFNSELFIKSINPGRSIGIPHISHNNVSNALIPLPPLLEQEEIVKKLDKSISYINEIEIYIKKNEEQAEQLLQVALKEVLEPESR
jgi:type I restriction enzyme S subunit